MWPYMESNNTMKKQFANETNTYCCIMCLSKYKLYTKEGHIVPLPKNMSPLTLLQKIHYIVVIAEINYIILAAIKLCVLVQFKSKVLMVKSNLHITDDLPITIRCVKRYRTKIMVKIQINKSEIFFFIKAIQTHQGSFE